MLRANHLWGGMILPFLLVAGLAASTLDASKAASTIDYGQLGPLDKNGFFQYLDRDPKIATRSPAATIALFRQNEAHPPHGTEDHPMGWDAIQEAEDYQRTLFYLAAQRAPELITPNDWKLVRAEEKDLIRSSCSNAGQSGVKYELSEAQCKRAGAKYQ